MPKNIPSDNLAYFERLKDYNNWVEKTHYFSNKTINVFIIAGVLLLIIGISKNINLLEIIGAVVTIYFGYEQAKREGHKEGYMYGYETAAEDQRLGLDELDFLNEE